MVRFTGPEEFRGAEFVDVDLTGSRFVEADLTGVVMRGVEVAQIDIDAPWLPHGGFFRVNGVDVIPLVEAQLDARFPGRAERRATDPDGLRDAWAAVEHSWEATLERAASMPPGTVEVSVAGEWTFSQTLRHLVHATDVWLLKGVLQLEDPFHPLGQVDVASADQIDAAAFATTPPVYAAVLEARAGRVAMVRDFIASVSPEQLDEPRANPHDATHSETVRSCLHVILEEEWEHLRFALRDLDAIASGEADGSDSGGLGSQP
jgi:hypothetical protein